VPLKCLYRSRVSSLQSTGPQNKTDRFNYQNHLKEKHHICYVRFQALMVMNVKVTALCDVTPHGLVEIDQHFRGTYCLYHQGDE
jgi:hypothetical protein